MSDILTLINRLVAAGISASDIAAGVFYIIGVVFVARGVMAMKRMSDGDRQTTWKNPISMFWFGALMIALPAVANSMSATIFGADANNDPSSIFNLSSTTGSIFADATSRQILVGILTLIKLFGMVAIGRGIFMGNQAVNSPGQRYTIGGAITFVIAGVCCVNMGVVVGMLDNLFFGA